MKINDESLELHTGVCSWWILMNTFTGKLALKLVRLALRELKIITPGVLILIINML
jgi:hypothetical protein